MNTGVMMAPVEGSGWTPACTARVLNPVLDFESDMLQSSAMGAVFRGRVRRNQPGMTNTPISR